MVLYKAETVSVVVSDGTISNGAGLSVTVGAASASTLTLQAASTTPTAGASNNLTVTAKDIYTNTATGYTRDKTLTFTGPATINGNVPKVTDKTGGAVSFGSNTTITFTNGVATVAGGNNGVMTLYKAETVSVVVSDGTISNGAGLSVTVGAASAASLTLQAASTTPTAGANNNLTVTAKDAYTNVATGYTGDKTLTFTGPATISGNIPTVSSKTGSAVNVGTSETITFTNGVANQATQVSQLNMVLYKVETVSVVVSDGTINNGAGLSVTVGPASAASLTLGAASTTPTAGAANNLTVTAKDTYTNTATGYTGDKTLTFTGPATINGNVPSVTSKTGTVVNVGTSETITFTNGVANQATQASQLNMTLYKAETVSVAVSDGTISNGAGLSVTVGSASAASLPLQAPPTTPPPGPPHNLTVPAKNPSPNPPPGYPGEKPLPFPGPAAI